MLTFGNEYKLHDPNEHKYDDGFTRYLDENDCYDDSSGDVESPTGWFGRAGKCIVVHDSVGFVSRYRYASVEDAVTAFSDMVLTYDDWSHECESDCWVCGGRHCGCTCGWCDVCHDYHNDSVTHED